MTRFKAPHQGDIVWLKVADAYGKEPAPHDTEHLYRPMLVLSRINTNRSGMIECMPMSSHNHMPGPYNLFMVEVDADWGQIHNQSIHGYVFTFQLLCYDLPSWNGRIVGHMNSKVTDKCLYYARNLIAKESN